MTRILLAVLLACAVAAPALAFNCPVVIKQAEDAIKKAETGKTTPETKALIDEAKKSLAEERVHHESAKVKRDHGDAVRKAKVATAFAEEAVTLAP